MTQGVGWHRIDRHSAVKKSLKLEKYIFLKKFKKRLAFCLKVVYDSRVANGSLVKRLRRRPLTAETGVRFPYELLTINNLIAQPIEDAESQIMVLQHFYFL